MKQLKPVLACMFFLLSIAGFAQAVEVGELDTSFGNEGRVETTLGYYNDQAYAVTVQPDGRILVAGSSANGSNLDFALVRYNEDGTLDKSFNISGVVTTQIGRDDDEVAALAVQGNGYIIAAGYSVTNGSRDFALARYMPDGELDYSFGQAGVVVTDYGSMDDEITALAVDQEGRIVVAGYSTGTAGRAVVIARYLPGGVLDPSFGYEGLSLTGIGDDALARSIDVDNKGRIVVAGSYNFGQRTEVMVLRFTDDGELDSEFGTDGLAVPSPAEASSEGFGIKVHENGAILVAGSVGEAGSVDTALFLFSENGQPETTFGENGMLVTEASQEDDMVLAVDVRGDSISLSGFATINGEREFLFVSHQLAVSEAKRVSFSLKTGNSTTGLTIGERQDVESYNDFEVESLSGTMEVEQTVVSTTPFGYSSDDISYAVTLQPDGKAVVAGFTEQGGVTSFAVARYGATVENVELAATSIALAGVSWITTREPFDVTRTGAISGGEVFNSAVSITKRGVVFSIAPDPIYKEGTDSPPPDGSDPGPVRFNGLPTGTLPLGTTEVELTLSTTVSATCKYTDTRSGMDYSLMKKQFDVTEGTSHREPISGLENGKTYTYWVRCQDGAGKTNTTDAIISFNIGTVPVISAGGPTGVLPAGTTTVTLKVTTDVDAFCNFSQTAGIKYDDMTNTFDTADGLNHSKDVIGLQDGISYDYYVRCRASTKETNETDYPISFSVAATSAGLFMQQMERSAGAVGSIFVSTAHAQTTTPTTTTTTTTTATTSNTGIFDFPTPEYLTEGNTEDGAGSGSYSSILENLKPGTFYYIRAYALTSDGDVYYGNQLGFNTADSCFVATAAYGSIFHPYVKVLRDFRDQYLLTSAPGRMFVTAYYKFSPPAADFISRHPLARRVVQAGLLPLVGLGWLLVQFGAGLLLVMVPVVLVSSVFAHRSWRRTHAV